MLLRPLAPAAALLLAFAVPAAGQPRDAPVTPQQLRRHIEVLASDAFEGRAPGSEGERRTIAYVAAQLGALGFEPGAADGSWYQSFGVSERRALRHSAHWHVGGRRRAITFDDRRITLIGSAGQASVHGEVVFVGHGIEAQLDGAELRGRIALMLLEGPAVPDFPSFAERQRTVAAAGAAAVIALVPDDVPWEAITAVAAEPRHELDIDLQRAPMVRGNMPIGEAANLVRASGDDLLRLLNERPGPLFRAVRINLRGSLEVTTEERRYTTHNVVGRLRGTAGGSETVLLLAHWDHLGRCRPRSAPDRICNGAVDNASGVAVLLEAAGRLALGTRPARDVVILATSAEEVGLLGATYYALRPTVPLPSIVAALNVDTAALTGRGAPVAIVGRGIAPLDQAIAAAAAEMGRRMDETFAADVFARRQDGWALARAGVPAAMVGGAFGDTVALNAFLAGDYHGPDDESRPDLPLDGAAEDANLIVALARRLADPALYRPPPR